MIRILGKIGPYYCCANTGARARAHTHTHTRAYSDYTAVAHELLILHEQRERDDLSGELYFEKVRENERER